MSTELPIACSLSASQLPQRLAEMAALGRDALVERHVDGAGVRLRFAGGPQVADRLQRVVAAEQECCAFLTMRVTESPGEIVLTATAPAGAEAVLAEWARAFGPDAAATSAP